MGAEGIQDKYVNPYTDFGFKLLFGTAMNKELLISFLNALLFKEEVVKDVTYLNTEHLGTQEYDRRAVFDVYLNWKRCSTSGCLFYAIFHLCLNALVPFKKGYSIVCLKLLK